MPHTFRSFLALPLIALFSLAQSCNQNLEVSQFNSLSGERSSSVRKWESTSLCQTNGCSWLTLGEVEFVFAISAGASCLVAFSDKPITMDRDAALVLQLNADGTMSDANNPASPLVPYLHAQAPPPAPQHWLIDFTASKIFITTLAPGGGNYDLPPGISFSSVAYFATSCDSGSLTFLNTN